LNFLFQSLEATHRMVALCEEVRKSWSFNSNSIS